MKLAAYIGGLLGLTLLALLLIRSDVPGMLGAALLGGWALLWLVPYRLLYFALYAVGWRELLRRGESAARVDFPFLLWATSVREAVDRLLPVASVGGAVVGVRLLAWRAVAVGRAGASVVIEMILTLAASWLFAVLGLVLLMELNAAQEQYRHLLFGILLSLPLLVSFAALLRHGSFFGRLGGPLIRLVGLDKLSQQAQSLDLGLRSVLQQRGSVLVAMLLQLLALLSGSFEVWLALRLFGHPVDWRAAVILESMTQALRSVAFVVPAGLGVQEASLVVFGHSLGVSSELALAVSLAKRGREVLCGLPALLSWQWMEARRLRMSTRNAA